MATNLEMIMGSAAGVILQAIGEPFEILQFDQSAYDIDPSPGKSIEDYFLRFEESRGIFDSAIVETFNTDSAVILDQPSIFFRTEDVGGKELSPLIHRIRRINTATSYSIINVSKDEIVSIRYLVQEV